MTALTMEHLDDGQLLELVDGSAPDSSRVHLGDCAACSARMTALSFASIAFHGAIQEPPAATLDAGIRARVLARPSPRTRWIATSLIAASILVVATAAVAAPVRHWIARRLGISTPAPQPVAAPKAAAPAAVPATSGMSVSFAPGDTVLRVRVTDWQSSGTLSFASSANGAVTAKVTDHAGAEEFFVAPNQLTIRNGSASSASYQVALPRQLRIVLLSIAGSERAISASSPGQPISLTHP